MKVILVLKMVRKNLWLKCDGHITSTIYTIESRCAIQEINVYCIFG